MTKERGKIYYNFLKDYPIGKIKETFKWAIQSLKFFPKVSELIEELTYNPRNNLDYWPDLTKPLLIDERILTPEEAKAALQKIFDRVEYGPKMTEKEIESDKKKVSERKAFLKKQLRELEIKMKGKEV